jgi:O-antigen ligase
LFCVLSALISATVSQYPGESRLKVGSLFLLLLYAGAGARMAIPRLHPEALFQRMLIGCEVVTWISAVLYLVFHFAFFGNPNSLGAVMGVIVVPVLLWGILTATPPGRRLRLGIELFLALLLLMSSYSRASMAAATIAFLFLCVGARRYRLLAKGLAGAVVIAMVVVIFLPRSAQTPDTGESDSLGSVFLYKGHRDEGVFESRKSVWQETWHSIKENTWFGTGFGTSRISEDMTKLQYANHHIDSWITREHGNSYLAIIEWSGLLGVIPFYALVGVTAANVLRVFAWLRRTGQVLSPAVLLAATVSAGLVHAMFEDWMFAVGYYICLIFWVNVFLLVDMLPRPAVVYSPIHLTPYQQRGFAAASGQ